MFFNKIPPVVKRAPANALIATDNCLLFAVVRLFFSHFLQQLLLDYSLFPNLLHVGSSNNYGRATLLYLRPHPQQLPRVMAKKAFHFFQAQTVIGKSACRDIDGT